MTVLYIAVPIAIAMGATALWACVRCIRSGQFDDLDSPAVRILLEDEPVRRSPNSTDKKDEAP